MHYSCTCTPTTFTYEYVYVICLCRIRRLILLCRVQGPCSLIPVAGILIFLINYSGTPSSDKSTSSSPKATIVPVARARPQRYPYAPHSHRRFFCIPVSTIQESHRHYEHSSRLLTSQRDYLYMPLSYAYGSYELPNQRQVQIRRFVYVHFTLLVVQRVKWSVEYRVELVDRFLMALSVHMATGSRAECRTINFIYVLAS